MYEAAAKEEKPAEGEEGAKTDDKKEEGPVEGEVVDDDKKEK
jgi:hypothetical protein